MSSSTVVFRELTLTGEARFTLTKHTHTHTHTHTCTHARTHTRTYTHTHTHARTHERTHARARAHTHTHTHSHTYTHTCKDTTCVELNSIRFVVGKTCTLPSTIRTTTTVIGTCYQVTGKSLKSVRWLCCWCWCWCCSLYENALIVRRRQPNSRKYNYFTLWIFWKFISVQIFLNPPLPDQQFFLERLKKLRDVDSKSDLQCKVGRNGYTYTLYVLRDFVQNVVIIGNVKTV